jgi:hypothetical protein
LLPRRAHPGERRALGRVGQRGDVGLARDVGAPRQRLGAQRDGLAPCLLEPRLVDVRRALARTLGRPVVVLAGREKLLPESIFALLSLVEGLPGSTSENGIPARNPLFERVPLVWADQLVTEAGVVGTAEALKMSLWTTEMEHRYLSLLQSNNMLDSC